MKRSNFKIIRSSGKRELECSLRWITLNKEVSSLPSNEGVEARNTRWRITIVQLFLNVIYPHGEVLSSNNKQGQLVGDDVRRL